MTDPTRTVTEAISLAIRIHIAASMGTATTIHERLGTVEQRLAWMSQASEELAELIRSLYPQPEPLPKRAFTWKTSL